MVDSASLACLSLGNLILSKVMAKRTVGLQVYNFPNLAAWQDPKSSSTLKSRARNYSLPPPSPNVPTDHPFRILMSSNNMLYCLNVDSDASCHFYLI